MNITTKHWSDGLISNRASGTDHTATLNAAPVSIQTGGMLRTCVQTMGTCLG